MIEKILSVVYVAIFAGFMFNLTYLFLGTFPFLRLKKLSEENIRAIKEYGLCHKTTLKGKKGIQDANTIKGSIGYKAYSNHFRKATFFFANAFIEKGEDFNDNFKYACSINITDVTDEQIQNLRIRTYDSAIVCVKDFVFDEKNKIEYKDIPGPKKDLYHWLLYLLGALKSFRFDKYAGAAIISAIPAGFISMIITNTIFDALALLLSVL